MRLKGTVFELELIELMKSVLEEAAATLPKSKRTSAVKTEIASRILGCAGQGNTDPVALRAAALSAIADHHHLSNSQPGDVRALTPRASNKAQGGF